MTCLSYYLVCLSLLLKALSFQALDTDHSVDSVLSCNTTHAVILSWNRLESGESSCKTTCDSERNELPSCQRTFYTPLGTCPESNQTFKLSFLLKTQTFGNYSGGCMPNEGQKGAFKMWYDFSNQALGMGFQESVQMRVGISLHQSPGSTVPQYTVEYSEDAFHWSHYTENERWMVFKNTTNSCLCRQVVTRFMRLKFINDSETFQDLQGEVEFTGCLVSKLGGADQEEESKLESLNNSKLYLGCHADHVATGAMNVYSGLAGYTEVDEKACLARCFLLNTNYWAINAGIFCFCGNDYNHKKEPESSCFQSYNAKSKKAYMRVYRVSHDLELDPENYVIEGTILGRSSAIGPTGNSETIEGVKFSVDFGDGEKIVACSLPITHIYKNPGFYKVNLVAEDPKGKKINFTGRARVYGANRETSLQCPSSVLVGNTLECKITADQASKISGNVSVAGQRIALDDLPESQLVRIGEHVPLERPLYTQHYELLNAEERTYVLTEHKVEQRGYIVGLEFRVFQEGPIRIQIVRPTGTEPRTTVNSPTECSSSQAFCLDQATCFNELCLENTTLVQSPQFAELQIVNDVFIAQSMSEGYNYVNFDNTSKVAVLPGDMLAWYSSGIMGKIAILQETSTVRCHVYKEVSYGGVPGEIISPGNATEALNVKFALSAYMIPLSTTKVAFNLSAVGQYSVVLHLNYSDSKFITQTENVYYQEVISNFTLNVPEETLTGNHHTVMSVGINTGTNVSYYWNFGDDKPTEVAVNQTNMSYRYSSSGNTYVQVFAVNEVSAVFGKCKLRVLDPVGEISVGLWNMEKAVIVNKTERILVSIKNGSNVNLSVSLGDGSPDVHVSNIHVVYLFVLVNNHTYNTTGVFNVTASAWNILSSSSAYQLIHSQLPVQGLMMSAPSTALSSIDLTVNMSVTQGTEVRFNVSLNSSSNFELFGETNSSVAKVVFANTTLRAGAFVLTVKAFNLVNVVIERRNITLHTEISGAELDCTTPIETGNNAASCIFFYQRGSEVETTFSNGVPGDRTSINLSEANSIRLVFGYTSPGDYTAKVNYSNTVSFVTLEKKIAVRRPIGEIMLLTDSPRVYPPGDVLITVIHRGLLGSPVSLGFHYGDGTTNLNLSFVGELNITHRYTSVGEYLLEVEVSNQVSSVKKNTTVKVLHRITFLLIKASSTSVEHDSRLVQKHPNVFPLEHSVAFSVDHDGEDISFAWNFGDGAIVSASSDATVEHTYNTAEEFTVSISAYFLNQTLANSTTIVMRKSLVGLSISDDAPGVKNTETNFTVKMEEMGTETVIKIDFGDGHITFFGQKGEESKIPPGQEFRKVNDGVRNISFSHVFKATGLYNVSVTGWNDVSVVKLFHDIVILEKRCRHPQLNILGVGKNPSSTVNITRDKTVVFRGENVFDCAATKKPVFEWKIYANSTEVLLQTDMDKAFLSIPPRSLPYSTLSIHYSVKMEHFINHAIQSETLGYVTVVPNDLKAAIYGGSWRTVSSERPITIDGSVSRDPDADGDDFNTMNFLWFCRLVDEVFPQDAEILTPADLNIISRDSTNGGCDGSGPRMLVYEEPVFTIDAGILMENMDYVFKLIYRRDRREATFEQTVRVVPGVPPEVAIECERNCENKVNSQSRMFVAAVCTNCLEEGFQFVLYQWDLYLVNEFNGSRIHLPDLSNKTKTPNNLRNLVIEKDALEEGKQYILVCRIYNEKGQEGRSEHHFKTNRPPQGGDCSLSPSEGRVMETLFQMQCYGWLDSEGGSYLTYKIFYETNTSNAKERLLLHGTQERLLPLTLPLGPPENNHSYIVKVKIFDNMGSYSVVGFPVKVWGSLLSVDDLKSLISSEGLLMNMLISGNQEGVLQSITSLSSWLDSLTSGSTEGADGSGDGDGDENSEQREAVMEMKKAIFEILKLIEPGTMDTMQLVVDALAAASRQDVSSTAQTTMMDALTNTASHFSKLKNTSSLEAVESFVMGMVDCIGNIFGATTSSQGEDDWKVNSGEDDDGYREAEMLKQTRDVTKAAMKVYDDSLNALLESVIPGQDPLIINSGSMSAVVIKMEVYDVAGTSINFGGGSFNFPDDQSIFGSSNLSEECHISAKGLNTRNNPFIWDNSASEVNSNCLGIQLVDCYGEPVNVSGLLSPIVITIPRENTGERPAAGLFTIEENTMKHHQINVTGPDNSLHAVVRPGPINCSHEFKIFLRYDQYPTTTDFDFNWTLKVTHGVDEWNDGFSLFVSNKQLIRSGHSGSGAGLYYLGLQYTVTEDSNQHLEQCHSSSYSLLTFLASCSFWDELLETWSTIGCEVAPETSYVSTVCRCNHLTNFGGGFFVAPNPIDFDAAFNGFTDVASNPVVVATVMTVFGLYFVLLLWARWRDKKDVEKIGVTPLPSNDPRDTYAYEITLQTGYQQRTRTTADIYIQLIGSLGDSEPRMLRDTKRAKFGRGEIDRFLMTLPQSLGPIKEIHIWHNNAGKSPAWYLFRVLVRDLQTEAKRWFVCDRWLAVEEDDGAVERRLQAATKEELTKFNILFVNATRKNLLDGHLWLSVFTRPPQSTFTRVQRLSCCLSLMLCTMLANLMFYQAANEGASEASSIKIGPFILSTRQIIIGIQSSFIVLPINMFIVTIFRRRKPKDENSKSQAYKNVEEVEGGSVDLLTKLSKRNAESQAVEEQIPYNETSGNKNKTFLCKNLLRVFRKDTERNNGQTKERKKKFLFPYWAVYIAYFMVAISSFTAGLFCMLYGFEFGHERSAKWLSSMMVSFWQSILVIQPFKVLLIAAFFALIIKDPNKDEEENESDIALNSDEEFLDQDRNEDRQTLSLATFCKPPDEKKLEAARKLKLKQCKMKAIVKEIISHFFVICVVLLVAYGNHDDRSFAMTNEVVDIFARGKPDKMPFDKLMSNEPYWSWVKDNLIPNLFPSSVSEDYPYMGVMENDKVSSVVGIGRIRQIRMKKDTCQIPKPMRQNIWECNDLYSWSDEETGDFIKGWIPKNSSTEVQKEPKQSSWQYQRHWESSSFAYMGKMASYRGGGFIVQLGPDDRTALSNVLELESNGWVDQYTRALFTEMAIYNVNINLLCVVTLLFEVLPTGGGSSFVNVQTLRLFRYIGNFSAVLLACEVIFAFLLIKWTLRDVKNLWKQGRRYWKKFWNMVEFTITCLSLSALVMYFTRLAFINLAVKIFREDRTKFVSFQYVVLLNEGVNAFIAGVVLLLNLKFLRILRFNRKVSVLSSTMKASAKSLFSFLFMFFVMFFAYCFWVYLTYAPSLNNYRSFIRCMVSMMGMILGNFQFYELVDINRIIGPTMFFTFMVIFQFVLINMFVGILCEAFNEVRYDTEKQSNDYEIMQFISNRLKAFVGLFVEPPIRPEYSWPKTELQQQVENIEEKAETTMYYMRNLCAEDMRRIRWFEPERWSHKKSKVMSLVLNAEVEILENDLCDGIEAMDKIIEEYSDHELDRMLAASRIRRRLEAEEMVSVASVSDTTSRLSSRQGSPTMEDESDELFEEDDFVETEDDDSDCADDSATERREDEQQMAGEEELVGADPKWDEWFNLVLSTGGLSLASGVNSTGSVVYPQRVMSSLSLTKDASDDQFLLHSNRNGGAASHVNAEQNRESPIEWEDVRFHELLGLEISGMADNIANDNDTMLTSPVWSDVTIHVNEIETMEDSSDDEVPTFDGSTVLLPSRSQSEV